MNKKAMLLVGVLLALGVCVSAALALDPMGSPTAEAEKGRWITGFEYFSEDSDIELDEAQPAGLTAPFKMNVEEQLVTAKLAYGLVDDLEIFVRLGGEISGEGKGTQLGSDVTFDGDSGFAFGVGVKASFYEQDKLEIGGLFQINWGDSEGKVDTLGLSGSVEGDTTEIGIAVGPSYDLTERISIYGGPFLYFIDGKVDGTVGGINVSYEIDEADYFGAYIGGEIDITDNVAFNLEWQHTGSADGLGMGLAMKF